MVSKYRETALYFGCKLCHHRGSCQGGKEKLGRFITQVDAIFYSLDVNSHTACKVIKKACKQYKKPLFFLPTSSINGFKTALRDWLED